MSPGSDTLIATVGHSPLPVVMAVRALQPTNVVLVHSEETLDVARRIENKLAGVTITRHRTIAKVPEQTVQDMKSVPGLDQADICTTSGTKAMSVALDIARADAAGLQDWSSWHVLDDIGTVVCAGGSSVPLPSLAFTIEDFAELHGWKAEPSQEPLAAASGKLPVHRKKDTRGYQQEFVAAVEALLVHRCPGRVVRLERISKQGREIDLSKPKNATWAIAGDRGVTTIGATDPNAPATAFWRVLAVADALGGEHARFGVVKYWTSNDAFEDQKSSDDTVFSLHHRTERTPTEPGQPIGFSTRIQPHNPDIPSSIDGFTAGGYLDDILSRDRGRS